MKIDHTIVGGLTGGLDPAQTQQARQAASQPVNDAQRPGGGTSRPSETGGRDQIDLSQLSRRLRELDVEAPERNERIQVLAAAVASASYHVDAAQLSRKMIDEALMPLG